MDGPDVAAAGSNYSDQGIDLDPLFNGVTSALSLPGFVQSWLKGEGACVPTGIESTQASIELNVFPNPAKDEINITGLNGNEIIYVYNSLGEIVQTVYAKSMNEKINVSGFSAGIFFYSIHNFNNDKIKNGSIAIMK